VRGASSAAREPGADRLLEDFLRQVESGRCTPRDPRSTVGSIYGPSGKP